MCSVKYDTSVYVIYVHAMVCVPLYMHLGMYEDITDYRLKFLKFPFI